MKKKIASFTGKTLAQVQIIIDDTLEWGANKLSEKKDSLPEKKPETTAEKGKYFLKKSVSFLGDIGSEYFTEYRRLQKKREDEK